MIVKFLHRISNWKFILPMFILFVANSYMFTHYQQKIDAIANEHVPILDMRDGGYTYEEVKMDFEKMGLEGQAIYKFLASKVDMIYPIVYGLFYMALIAFFTKKITDSKLILLILAFVIPLLSMIVDYFENFNNVKLLSRFPNITRADVEWGTSCTQLKFGMVYLTSLVIVATFIIWVVKWFNNRKM